MSVPGNASSSPSTARARTHPGRHEQGVERQRHRRREGVDVGETQLFELLANQAQNFLYLMRGPCKTKIPWEVWSVDMLRTPPVLSLEEIQLPGSSCTTSAV